MNRYDAPGWGTSEHPPSHLAMGQLTVDQLATPGLRVPPQLKLTWGQPCVAGQLGVDQDVRGILPQVHAAIRVNAAAAGIAHNADMHVPVLVERVLLREAAAVPVEIARRASRRRRCRFDSDKMPRKK